MQELRPIELALILADPRWPYPYTASGRLEAHHLRDDEAATEALGALEDIHLTVLNDHDALFSTLEARRFDLAVNFCNAGFRNRPELQMHVPALLEMLGQPFVGADAACLALCHDKNAVNAAAAERGVPTPRQQLLDLSGEKLPRPDLVPALLKPNGGSGSEGIDATSIVHEPGDAQAPLARLRDGGVRWVVAEELLPGEELTVSVLDDPDGGPRALPPVRADFSNLPPGRPPIMTHASKADETSPEYRGVGLAPAEDPDARRAALEPHCRAMFRRLGCRDYARFDFRDDAEGVPRLIDVNAHPEFGPEGMLARSADFAGLDYGGLVASLVNTARGRSAAGAGGGRDD